MIDRPFVAWLIGLAIGTALASVFPARVKPAAHLETALGEVHVLEALRDHCSADGVAAIKLCSWGPPAHCEPCTVLAWSWTRCSLAENRRSSSAYIRKLPWIHDGGVVAVSWGEQLEVPAIPDPHPVIEISPFHLTCISPDPSKCR